MRKEQMTIRGQVNYGQALKSLKDTIAEKCAQTNENVCFFEEDIKRKVF